MTKEQFIGELDNWCSHRPALWDALQMTKGHVIELGMGDGSTRYLNQYCNDEKRKLTSYDSNITWVMKFSACDHQTVFVHPEEWWTVNLKCSLLFIDHSPGERRKIDLERAANIAQVIVVHDTEPSADHGYQVRDVLKTFKYLKDYETPGAWTTVVSNFIDISKWNI
jgi:hypothetical protein